MKEVSALRWDSHHQRFKSNVSGLFYIKLSWCAFQLLDDQLPDLYTSFRDVIRLNNSFHSSEVLRRFTTTR